MEKRRLFSILAKADRDIVASLANEIQKRHFVSIIKEPGKTLTMIQVREPVKQSLFYLGEVIVCEAIVELDNAKGVAVTMGDDIEKTLNMAIIDAAVSKGVFDRMDILLTLEEKQRDYQMSINALHLKTMVNFSSMDEEEPQDVSAYKKA